MYFLCMSVCSPLMLNDSSSAHSVPKYSRPFSLEHVQVMCPILSELSITVCYLKITWLHV